MTHEELWALPDVTPHFVPVARTVDGRRLVIPTLIGTYGALFQKADDGVFVDRTGRRWITGWVDGVHARRAV